jgi:hypothetical protein
MGQKWPSKGCPKNAFSAMRWTQALSEGGEGVVSGEETMLGKKIMNQPGGGVRGDSAICSLDP